MASPLTLGALVVQEWDRLTWHPVRKGSKEVVPCPAHDWRCRSSYSSAKTAGTAIYAVQPPGGDLMATRYFSDVKAASAFASQIGAWPERANRVPARRGRGAGWWGKANGNGRKGSKEVVPSVGRRPAPKAAPRKRSASPGLRGPSPTGPKQPCVQCGKPVASATAAMGLCAACFRAHPASYPMRTGRTRPAPKAAPRSTSSSAPRPCAAPRCKRRTIVGTLCKKHRRR